MSDDWTPLDPNTPIDRRWHSVSPLVARFFNAFATAGLGAAGGALAVYSGYDDAPGGVLIGIVLIAAAVALGLRASRGKGTPPTR